MRDSRSANGRIPDPFARDEIDSPRVTDRVYGRHTPSPGQIQFYRPTL